MNSNESQNMGFLDIIWRYKFRLAIFVVLVSFASFTFLYLVGGVPDELKLINNASSDSVAGAVSSVASNTSSSAAAIQTAPSFVLATSSKSKEAPAPQPIQVAQGDLPIRIVISKIGVDASVSDPSSDDVNVLNSALLKGAVRYPGSGTLGQGNLFVFGHSTGIRIVNNQAYKTFDHLNYLNIGDEIKVDSDTMEYTYKVTSVALVDDSEALVDFTQNKNMLTISTCNVFGQKQQRFVVQAIFDSSREK